MMIIQNMKKFDSDSQKDCFCEIGSYLDRGKIIIIKWKITNGEALF